MNQIVNQIFFVIENLKNCFKEIEYNKMRKCQRCQKLLNEDQFDQKKQLGCCNICVSKYLKQTNLFWIQFPDIAKYVPEEFKELHPKLTIKSKQTFEMTCPECQETFTTSPVDIQQTGFCLYCKKYLIPLDKAQLKNACIDEIVKAQDYNQYMVNIQHFKPTELGFIQEFFAFLYFNIHKHLFNIKHYISYSLTKDKTVLKSLGLPKTDMGTDAVIVHTDKEISLVQVKWRSKETCHNRSVFYGMSIDALTCKKPIKHLFLFSNAINVSDTLPTSEKFKYIQYEEMINMNWKFFKKNVVKYRETNDFQLVVPKLNYRQWQHEANEFAQDKKICTIVAPPGAGKTLFAFSMLDGHDKVLIVVPSLQLLSQWFYTFATRLPDTEFLLVGSQHETDLDTPYSLTTDSELIEQIFNNSTKLITICTYHSFEQVSNCKFDITFIDEAHLTTGNGEWNLVTQKSFRSDKKIYLTATPKIYKGQLTERIISMDDESKYGLHYTYSCRQAIEDGILCDYKVVLGQSETIEDGFPDSQKYDLYSKFLCMCIEKYDLERILIASNSHASSSKFFSVFKSMFRGKHELVLMKANATANDKNKVLSEIPKKQIIVFNVRIFTLGTDMPSLDTVFFHDDKKSKIDIIQTAMRCLRTCEGKKKAYIVIPAFCGKDLSVKNMGDYPIVRNTLSALGTQDSAIFEEVVARVKRAKDGKVAKRKESDRIEFVDIEDVDLSDLDTRLFDRLGNLDRVAWMIQYEKLKEYASVNGKLPLQKQGGSWLDNQRQYYKKNKLSSEQISLLEQIEHWTWEPHKDQWNKMYNDLVEYIAKYNKLPPFNLKGIGKWVNKQRTKYETLSQERINKLNKIEIWSWNLLESKWKQNYDKLVEYIAKYDKLPTRNEEGLGNWVSTQRTVYKRGKLSEQRIELLEKLKYWKLHFLS